MLPMAPVCSRIAYYRDRGPGQHPYDFPLNHIQSNSAASVRVDPDLSLFILFDNLSQSPSKINTLRIPSEAVKKSKIQRPLFSPVRATNLE